MQKKSKIYQKSQKCHTLLAKLEKKRSDSCPPPERTLEPAKLIFEHSNKLNTSHTNIPSVSTDVHSYSNFFFPCEMIRGHIREDEKIPTTTSLTFLIYISHIYLATKAPSEVKLNSKDDDISILSDIPSSVFT